ncbi:MAG TPA: GntR family transcriptional regulator [Burkholderiales bacterium]|nr:GntR family transcriptional regulator [Burkholderiales bacterium]
MTDLASKSRAIAVYERIKRDIFDFSLLPGDRFTETEVAERAGVSRTPVREALYRLEREGYIQVSSRNGWSVKPFDFAAFENLYDVRVILELAAVRKVCDLPHTPGLDILCATWLVPAGERLRDPQAVCALDEAFHERLVAAAGNPELARIHGDVSERIRIIRRLDFTQTTRIDATYEEHAGILRNVMRRRVDQAHLLLRSHIDASKAVVRQITLHRLHSARTALARGGDEDDARQLAAGQR